VGFFARLFKAGRLRRAHDEMVRLLRERYGFEKSYSAARVAATVAVAKVDPRETVQLCAMYSPRDEFVTWMQKQETEQLSFAPEARSPETLGARYDALRAEAAKILGGAQFLPEKKAKETWDPLENSSVDRSGI
jgi:hypothetical protein